MKLWRAIQMCIAWPDVPGVFRISINLINIEERIQIDLFYITITKPVHM